MTKKGTGWVPDFPDVKDYTLNSKSIQALASQVQTDQVTESVESLTKQVSEALKLLKSQSVDPKTETEGSQKLNSLIEKLDRTASGGIYFAPAKREKIFKPGMSAPEIMKAKWYLQSIYPGRAKEEYGFHFNQVFDEITKSLIEGFQTDRGIPANGIVDDETMGALKWTFNTKKTGDFEAFCQQILPQGGDIICNTAYDFEFSRQNQKEGPLTIDSLSREIIKIKNAVANVRGYLECQKILTPLIDDWLNLSDNKNELASQLAKAEKTLNAFQETDTTGNIIDTINQDIDWAIELFCCRLYDIPAALNPQDLSNSSVSIIRKILGPIPDKLLEIILKNLLHDLPDFNFKQFIKPVTISTIFSMSSDAGSDLSYIADESSLKTAKNYIDNGIRRLTQQLHILGISLPDILSANGFNEISGSVIEALNKFKKNYGIVHANPSYDFLCEQVSNAVQKEIYQLFYPIAKVVWQSIMPIGQHSNLQKAVEKEIEAFNRLFSKGTEQKAEKKLKQLIIEAIQESVTETTSFFKDVELVNDTSYMKYSSCEAVRETIKNVERRITAQEPGSLEYHENKLRYTGRISIYKAICNVLNSYLGVDCLLAEEKEGKTDRKNIKLEDTSLEQQLLLIAPPHTEPGFEADLKILLNLQLSESLGGATRISLPDFVDLSLWCSSIEDQGELNSCTAQAGVALTEYFAKKASGKYIDVSSLFLYKAARNLMQREGDTGASVRETMKAMVLFGIPPEEHWPYDEEKFDEEPTSFCYSFAQSYQALKYFRIDYAGITNDTLLIQIKAVLVAGFPCMFGFTIYTSIYDEVNMDNGHIPYPKQFDKMEGGHAVVAVGYDDHHIIENADGKQSEGAILIRNSWGTDWGAGGYGWLPYDYVLAGLTADWWSLFQSEWFESGQFGVGASHWASSMGAGGGGPRR